MKRLIQDMLDVASADAGALACDLEPLLSGELLQEAAESQRQPAEAAGLELTVELREPLPPILGDRHRLLQVLDNLIGNALKFCPPRSEVVLSARRQATRSCSRSRTAGRGSTPTRSPTCSTGSGAAARRTGGVAHQEGHASERPPLTAALDRHDPPRPSPTGR